MLPRLASVGGESQQTRLRAEGIGSEGLVLMSVEALMPTNPDDILHWRLADGKKPPLDLSISLPSRTFWEVTFFIADERIPVAEAHLERPPAMQGTPIFDLSLWSGGVHYTDQLGRTIMVLAAADLIVTFDRTDHPFRAIDAGAMHFLLSQDDRMIGFILPNLDHTVVELLRAANVLDLH